MDRSAANRLFLWLLFLLLLAGCVWYAWWFFSNFEEYSEQVRVDISPQAKRNPYLAAERFLQQMGVSAQSRSGHDIFSHPIAEKDTILLAGNSRFFLERNHERLHDWVSNGGNLILVPAWTFTNEEPFALLKQFEIELHSIWEPSDDESENNAGSCNVPTDDSGSDENTSENDTVTPVPPVDNKEPIADNVEPVEDSYEAEPDTVVFKTGQEREYLADFQGDLYLMGDTEKAEIVIGTDERPHLMRYPVGNGTMTVLSDMELFDTRHIGEQDHAYLLYELVPLGASVWLYYSADMPSLLSLIWNKAPYLVVLMLLVLLLAVWRLLGNSGPKLEPQFESRRNLLENLDASAEYSWRVDRAQQMFSENRNAVEQAWRRRHPQLNVLDEDGRCEWIAEQAGLAARAVKRTLYEEVSAEQDFIRASAVLQRLATEAGRYGRKSQDK